MARTSTPALLTIEQARQRLDAAGESIADFARRKGVDAQAVYQVLSGEKKGRRGKAHRAAVALGVKAGDLSAKQPAVM